MTINKKAANKATTPDDTATPVGEIIKSKKKKLTKSQNSVINCSKCNRAFKSLINVTEHEKKCNGKIGGGMPKGAQTQKTKELRIQKEAMQQMIASRTNELIAAQFRQALGQARLFMRVKVPMGKLRRGHADSGNEQWTFKVTRVTDEADFMIYLSLPHNQYGGAKDKTTGVEYFYMESKGGNYLALSNLLDRAYGKPKENVELGEDPDAPLPKHGTGTTTELRKAMIAMVKQQIKDGGKK
jgi:hypothetical protein